MIRAFGPDRRPRSRGYSLPAPTGGWNARDSLAAMPENDAVRLDNWFPETSTVRMRRGYDSYATGFGAATESLMTWSFGGTEKLFAASNGGVYDISSAGAIGAAEFSGMTNDRWQHANFGTAGGNFLYIVNGADAPRYYNGSTWTTPTITGSGLTAANLVHVNVFKRRLFFVEKNKLKFWYFPAVTISGAITAYDISSLCSLGGELIAMGTWTRDGGDGLDDLAIFVTSKGQVVVFQGTDPDSDTTWALVGVYNIGAPIGRRCFVKFGTELVIITEDGFAPLSQFLSTARTNETAAISHKIKDAVVRSVRDYRDNFGWQAILYPKGNQLLVNIPANPGVTTYQYVMNSSTGAWCRFLGMQAECWEVYGNDLYFGSATAVYKADSGEDDAGAAIEADGQTAYSYFNTPGYLKRFTMARPILKSEGTVRAAVAVSTDFRDRRPSDEPTFSPGEGAAWDEGIWDVSSWAGGEQIFKDWASVQGVGYTAAIRILTQAQQDTVYWMATDFVWEPGSLI